MYFWQLFDLLIYGFGAAATLWVWTLTPKASSLLSTTMMVLIFWGNFINCFSEFYITQHTAPMKEFRERQFSQCSIYLTRPIIWWLICYLFIDVLLTTPRQRLYLNIFSVLNIGFTLVYYTVCIVHWYNNYMNELPQFGYVVQQYLYYTISLITLLIIRSKNKKGTLKLNKEFLDADKIYCLLCIKASLFVLELIQ